MLCVVGLIMVLQEQSCAKTHYLGLALHPKTLQVLSGAGHTKWCIFTPHMMVVYPLYTLHKVPSCRVCWMLVTGNWWILDGTRYLDPAQPLVPFTRKA